MSAFEVVFFTLVAGTCLLISLAVRSAAERRRAGEARRLGASDESGEIRLPPGFPGAAPAEPGARTRFDRWFDTAVQRSGLDASPAGVVAVMLLGAIVLGAGLYLWKNQLGLAALGVAAGFAVPLAVVSVMYRRHRWRLQEQIPDAFRTLAGSVRAGLTIEQAIDFYAREGNKPLADEFAACTAQMRLGLTPAAALKAVGDRVRLIDFDLLVSTVGLYMTTGGNLVLLLERLAEGVRERNQFRNHFFAQTAQSRVVAIALGVAAPLFLLGYALAEPEHVQTFFNSAGGWGVLAGCVVLELIGVVWLWQILRVDV